MNLTDVAVATMSLARDPDEERLVVRSVAALAAHGMPVSIADGGSPPRFVAALAAIAGVTMVPAMGRGLVAQVRGSVRAAAGLGTPFVLYTEPDKLEFFARGLAPFLASASGDPKIGATLAARSAEAFATFPSMQRTTEGGFNALASAILGYRTDFTYGPFLLNRALAPAIVELTEDVGWGWRPFVFGLALRDGYRLEARVGDFVCPEDQRVETEGDRGNRLRQLAQNVSGLALSQTIPRDFLRRG